MGTCKVVGRGGLGALRFSIGLAALSFGALSCGSGDGNTSGAGGATQNSSDSCAQRVDALLARVAACLTLTAQQRQQAIAECQAGMNPDPSENWRPEFKASVDECGTTVSCDDYLENLDDICYPPALAAHATGLIADRTIAECILGGTADCDAELALLREPSVSVVAACFRRWQECADQRADGDPYWTEDQCGSLIALPDSHRTAAEPCTSLPCAEVSACLETAGAFAF